MKPIAADSLPAPQPDFIERRGGWILSGCFHIMLFSVLIIYKPERQIPVIQHTPIEVILAGPEATPLPTMGMVAVLPPTPPQTQATQARETREGDGRDALADGATQEAPGESGIPGNAAETAKGDPDGVTGGQGKQSAPKNLAFLPVKRPPWAEAGSLASAHGISSSASEAEETLAESKELKDRLASSPPGAAAPGAGEGGGSSIGLSDEELLAYKRLGEQMGKESGAEGWAGSSTIAGRMSLARVDLKAQSTLYGKKDPFSSRGASEGAMRDLDTSGVPQDEAQKVFARYGIKILLGQASAGSKDAAFLNRAVTGEGKFVSKYGRGKFRMFSFGSAAVGRMVQLEEESLRARGLNPAKTRVVRVLFGVVVTKEGYDLGVKEIEAVPVMPPDPKLNQQLEPAKPAEQPASDEPAHEAAPAKP